METLKRKNNIKAAVLFAIGIGAGTAIGVAVHYLAWGIGLGIILGISLAWFARLRGS